MSRDRSRRGSSREIGRTDRAPFKAAVAAFSTLLVACGGGGTGSRAAPVQVLDAEGVPLGSVAFAPSCSEAAVEPMRRGLALLHHMTFVEAEAEFRTVTELDPGCAMGYWGVAMSFLHPLWPDQPSDEALEEGWALLQRARDIGGMTPREEAYVAALEAYYRDGAERSEPERLASYQEAWAAVAATYPDDPEAALFSALSLVATASDADKTFAARVQAGEIAEGVLQRIPDHPGAHHYVIHAFDVPPLAERAIATARNYGEVAPENAHALHMTSHIFTRVGAWEESIDYNARSAEAAWREPIGGATSHHHLHALDYLAYAHLQRAEDDLAWQVAEHVASLEGPVVNHAGSAYTFAAVPARLALETQDWEAAMAVPIRVPSTIPWDSYPHLEAIPHFARALGAAHLGQLDAARSHAGHLAELQQEAAALPGAYDWGIQVRIQEVGARAWIAFAEGNADEAVRLMTEAADLEATTEKNPVTPGEVLPARELLGDLLLELGRFEDARAAYQTALERSPNRFNSLYGAGRAAEQAGDAEAARSFYQRLVDITAPDATGRPRLEQVRASLEG